MKKIIAGISVFALIAIAFPLGAAQHEAGVTATVTVENIAVSVSDGGVAYGALATSAFGDTTSNGVNDSQTVTNDGNVNEDFVIRGDDTATWTLEVAIGANQYTHDFCITTCDTTPVWNALSTSNTSLVSTVAPTVGQVFDLQIQAPSSDSSAVQQSAVVTVVATAS